MYMPALRMRMYVDGRIPVHGHTSRARTLAGRAASRRSLPPPAQGPSHFERRRRRLRRPRHLVRSRGPGGGDVGDGCRGEARISFRPTLWPLCPTAATAAAAAAAHRARASLTAGPASRVLGGRSFARLMSIRSGLGRPWSALPWSLDRRLGVAVAREPLDVDLGYGQLVRQIVRVIDAARLGEPLTQGGLLPQHLGEIRVAVLAVARVQPLSKCVHYADLEAEAKHKGVAIHAHD
jgi:hypothetical protein